MTFATSVRRTLAAGLLATGVAAALGAPMANAASVADRVTLQSLLGGPGALENFELFNPGITGASVLDCALLTSASTCQGQGPGLVQPGLTFSGAGSLQWNDAAYYGAPSRELLSNGAALNIDFASPVTAAGFDLRAFAGYAATASIEIYASDDTTQIGSIPTIVLANDGFPVFAGWQDAAGIGRIVVSQPQYGWSPMIDNLEYRAAATATPEPASAAPLGAGIALAAWRRRRPLRAG
jgi:hypothetical protein